MCNTFRNLQACVAALSFLVFQSCQNLRSSAKFGFNEGYYKSRIFHKKVKVVYVVPEDDSIRVYTKKALQKSNVDPEQSLKLAFPKDTKPDSFTVYHFRKNSFDIDLATILLRYRPALDETPHQFAPAPFNWSAFFGYRTDLYKLNYKQTPLRKYKRDITHYGFSGGLFTGIGSTAIHNGVTRGNVTVGYDAPVFLTGVAAFFGIERFSYGFASGYDFLLDQNRRHWIYQGRRWYGLSVGWNIH
ncbi:MAG TPA: hypothetical protein VEZ55_13310 [Chitinophagaceae bacterium]|nr:hypothetical protein [Chitinophagaceae bacterium]